MGGWFDFEVRASSLQSLSCLNFIFEVGSWWQLVAVGGSWWQLVAVGGSWWQLVAVGGSWWQLAECWLSSSPLSFQMWLVLARR